MQNRIAYAALGLLALLVMQSTAGAQSEMAGMTMDDPTAHQDHNSKHGGQFFMAMDNKHHLEGVLLTPGIFKVYLYDEHTQPLSAAEMKKTSGVLHFGDSKEAPAVPLKMSKDGQTFEASLTQGMKPPVTLTLLMQFPGMKPTDRPELFTFVFKDYTKQSAGSTAQSSQTADHSGTSPDPGHMQHMDHQGMGGM